MEEYRAQVAQSLPQKRYLKPEEVGALAVFLCRPEALGHRGPGHHHRHGLAMVRAAGVKAGKSRRGGAASGPALAFWLEYPSLPACEIAALCGYDAVIFDHEHGVMPQADADRLTLACKRLGLTVYSRVAIGGARRHPACAGFRRRRRDPARRSPISPMRGR